MEAGSVVLHESWCASNVANRWPLDRRAQRKSHAPTAMPNTAPSLEIPGIGPEC